MIKRISVVILILLMTLTLGACGSQKQANEIKNKAENAPKQVKNDLTKIPEDIKEADMGTGTFYITTSSGTSEKEEVPTIYAKKDTKLLQASVNTRNFDGKHLSYIFVDGVLNTKEQLSDNSATINLKDNNLKAGKHRVDIVQFNGDKISDKVITHKLAYYQVKSIA